MLGTRAPLKSVFKKTLLILPVALLLGAALPFMFYNDSRPLFHLGGLTISYSPTGINLWALLGFKAFLAILCLAFVTSLKPISELLASLGSLGLPKELVSILLFTYRYLFVLKSEGSSIVRAAQSRNFRPRHLAEAQVTGGIIANLLLRSMERAERTYQAMTARGFTGQLTYKKKQMTLLDFAALSLWILLLVVLRLRGL